MLWPVWTSEIVGTIPSGASLQFQKLWRRFPPGRPCNFRSCGEDSLGGVETISEVAAKIPSGASIQFQVLTRPLFGECKLSIALYGGALVLKYRSVLNEPKSIFNFLRGFFLCKLMIKRCLCRIIERIQFVD
jgi:hypothetical protein